MYWSQNDKFEPGEDINDERQQKYDLFAQIFNDVILAYEKQEFGKLNVEEI